MGEGKAIDAFLVVFKQNGKEFDSLIFISAKWFSAVRIAKLILFFKCI